MNLKKKLQKDENPSLHTSLTPHLYSDKIKINMTKILIEIDEIEVSCDQALKSVRYKLKKPELMREIWMQSGSIGASTNAPTQYRT